MSPPRRRCACCTRCSRSRRPPRTQAKASRPSPRSAGRTGRAADMADELHNWGPLVDDVSSRKEVALGMGGPERIARQQELGKLPVRDRLDILLDKGSFTEYG